MTAPRLTVKRLDALIEAAEIGNLWYRFPTSVQRERAAAGIAWLKELRERKLRARERRERP